ncbi:MAG: polysaccharide biosynthesis protein, partial [Muribaculaceae bacterium]|nr:polysaccharide biosynthesis protein [Muribaculaceae bacterium]
MSHSEENKRIAKNSLYLYLRKLITVFIGLYSSRLLLEQLGLDDFGLYGLVGSVIMLFGSIKVLFTDSIRRFINIEKGRCNPERIRLIFTYGVILNLLIAVIFVAIVEIAGFIMIPKLNIAPESVPAAIWVLQFSLASAVVTIMNTPY